MHRRLTQPDRRVDRDRALSALRPAPGCTRPPPSERSHQQLADRLREPRRSLEVEAAGRHVRRPAVARLEVRAAQARSGPRRPAAGRSRRRRAARSRCRRVRAPAPARRHRCGRRRSARRPAWPSTRRARVRRAHPPAAPAGGRRPRTSSAPRRSSATPPSSDLCWTVAALSLSATCPPSSSQRRGRASSSSDDHPPAWHRDAVRRQQRLRLVLGQPVALGPVATARAVAAISSSRAGSPTAGPTRSRRIAARFVDQPRRGRRPRRTPTRRRRRAARAASRRPASAPGCAAAPAIIASRTARHDSSAAPVRPYGWS